MGDVLQELLDLPPEVYEEVVREEYMINGVYGGYDPETKNMFWQREKDVRIYRFMAQLEVLVRKFRESRPAETHEGRTTCTTRDGHILYNALPSCPHEVREKELQQGGGIECVKCGGWFCY